MLITKDFVVINNPKTGSTFVRECLKKIYQKRYHKLTGIKKISVRLGLTQTELIELLMRTDNNVPAHQHGRVSQIPKAHQSKTIVSVLRNPYSRFLSQYEFRYWATHYQFYHNEIEVKKYFPNFPNLNLDQFVDFQIFTNRNRLHLHEQKIGKQTLRFIEMFFNDPQQTIKRIKDDYIFSGAYKKRFETYNLFKAREFKR